MTMYQLKNMTLVAEFILLGFSPIPQFIPLVFCLVLLSYILTMLGNFLILTLVFLNSRMQSPMYLFLVNLAVVDICFINTTVPNFLNNITKDRKTISLACCLTQLFFYFFVGTVEFLLLAVMSIDRYLAICYPLHYAAIMKKRVCIQLITGVWLGSFFSICIPVYFVMKLKFCFPEIDHFFCDVGPLLKNSCTNTAHIENWVLFASSSLFIVSFSVTFLSYMTIIITVVKIHSAGGKQRVFSTCSSHGIVVTLVYGSCMFMYSRPTKHQEFSLSKKVSILNTIVVPLINPFIYTLRNQNVKETIVDVFLKLTKN
ncbi:olfactory receptor 2AP1-like [Pseudophryne corroboree]|uniref:olfactory receptor 2AP1-like n=1 Tax=Pseudophryne corroboree TaxID=495146 RepID=UPI003081B94F